MADNVEIKGTVESVRNAQVNNQPIVRALFKSSKGSSFICIWRADQAPQNLKEGLAYTVSGTLKTIEGKACMIQPSIKEVFGPTTKAKKRKKLSLLKKLIAVAVFIILGLAVAFGVSQALPSNNTVPITGSPLAKPAKVDTPVLQPAGVAPKDCSMQPLPFKKVTKNDSSLPKGVSKVTTQGVDGTEKVCYTNGRDKFPIITIEQKPIDQVTSVGF